MWRWSSIWGWQTLPKKWKLELKLDILLLDCFTFLVGILPAANTFWAGPVKKQKNTLYVKNSGYSWKLKYRWSDCMKRTLRKREQTAIQPALAQRSEEASIFIGPRSPGPIYVSGSQWVREWVSKLRLWNFTDVILADEDTNSILTDKVNRTIQGNVAKQL